MDIGPGDTRYRVNVRIESDFDGFIGEEEDSDDTINDLIRQIESSRQEELEDGVYEEMNFILCVNCREMFRGEVTGMYAGYSGIPGKMKWQ